MKRAIGLLLFGISIVSVFVDVRFGTLPSTDKTTEQVVTHQQIPYQEMIVKRGDTVLSIMERQGAFPNVSIEQIVQDFIRLNDGLTPEEMKPGNVYKFPVYELPNSE
ncbi:hypothetical protein [Fervidibacillus albus]|uniref:LysM domain-containing protein n=1 Tax=Fervidibacillus albus TaxID=2980026 RepID=A0A9E8LVE1_9BACI|nr:hypothetical protein [Fervidibacillus albus]WAA10405.1 hypothetical protein OE104_03485 [Fervidibacillus albus]